MSLESDLARESFARLLAEAAEAKASTDVIGRALLGEILTHWQQSRPWTDVADELRFTADNLDPSTDFEFMRP